MPTFIRCVFRQKMLVRFAILVAGIAAAVAIFYAEENWRGRRAWGAYRTAAEKRGVKLFLKDFVPPDIPDSENYAATPIIRELFVKKRDGVTATSQLAFPRENRPRGSDDLKERRFDPAIWQEFFLKTGLLSEKSDDAARDILRALEKYEPLLQKLRDASVRPRCRFPARFDNDQAASTPHLGFWMTAAHPFALRIATFLARGNSTAARREFEQVKRLYSSLSEEPTLIVGLVRLTLLHRLGISAWDGLAAGQWEDGDLKALEAHLAGLRVLEDCHFAFASERGFVNAGLLDLAKRGLAKIQEERSVFAFLGADPDVSFRERMLWHTLPKGWIFHSMVHANEYFDWFCSRLEKANDGTGEKILRSAQSSGDWLREHSLQLGIERFAALSLSESVGVFESGLKKYLHAHTRMQEARLACTLERFRRAKASFPEKLDELVPDFIDAIPRDVFDAKPLRYRRSIQGGYDLWSIGPDRKDDSGKIDPEEENIDQADWIWHMPGRP